MLAITVRSAPGAKKKRQIRAKLTDKTDYKIQKN